MLALQQRRATVFIMRPVQVFEPLRAVVHPQLDVEPDCLQHLLNGFHGFRGVLPDIDAALHLDLDGRVDTGGLGFGQQLLRQFRIVRVRLFVEFVVVAGDGGDDHLAGDQGVLGDDFLQGFKVYGVDNGQPHPLVVHRWPGRIHAQERRLRIQVAVVHAGIVGVLHGDVVSQVGLADLHHGGAYRRFLAPNILGAGDPRLLAPVVLIANDVDFNARRPVDQLIRTGADGRTGEADFGRTRCLQGHL